MLIEDPAGVELLAATFSHDEDGISALCSALGCFEVEVAAIERPDGLLVDRLLEAGVRVLALHPNQVKAIRALTRAREDLVAARVALANQLRAELERCWPVRSGSSQRSTARSRSRF